MNKVTVKDMKEITELFKKKWGTKVEWISTETDMGLQFYNMGGVGGILRWAL